MWFLHVISSDFGAYFRWRRSLPNPIERLETSSLLRTLLALAAFLVDHYYVLILKLLHILNLVTVDHAVCTRHN